MKRFALSILIAACGGGGGGATPDAARAIDAPVSPAAPVVTITAPIDHAVIGTGGDHMFTVTGTIATTRTIASAAITINGTPAGAVTVTGGAFSTPVTLVDNDQTIVVTATDDLAQTGMATVHVTYPFITFATFAPAAIVLGQPDATSSTGGTTAGVAHGPSGRGWWDGSTLWLGDQVNGRGLGFAGFPSRTGEPATIAVGAPDLTTAPGSTASATLAGGIETLQVAAGKLFALDYVFNRLLVFDTVPTSSGAAAGFALGQTDTMSKASGCGPTSLATPEDMLIVAGKLVVADSSNNRILIWNTVPTQTGVQPDLVLGQADLLHCQYDDDNQDGTHDAGPSARTLAYATGVWSDGTKLIVADSGNNRVVIWETFPASSFVAADHVLGQADLTHGDAAAGQIGMNGAYYVDSNGNQLAVSDYFNNRVLIWNSIPATDDAPADVVLGQGDFTHSAGNDDNQDGTTDATPSGRTLHEPSGVRFVRDTLVVGDFLNSRWLVFGTLPCPTGQYETPPGSGTCVADPCVGACTGQLCDNSTGAAVCF